jgi:hypothetical protein
MSISTQFSSVPGSPKKKFRAKKTSRNIASDAASTATEDILEKKKITSSSTS